MTKPAEERLAAIKALVTAPEIMEPLGFMARLHRRRRNGLMAPRCFRKPDRLYCGGV